MFSRTLASFMTGGVKVPVRLPAVSRNCCSTPYSTAAMKRLDNKVAIVTASTDGIGLAIAKRLAEEGAKVVVSSRKEANVKKAVDELKKLKLEVLGVKCHVGDAADRKRLFDETIKTYGKLDILVSNAATNPAVGGVLDCEEGIWDKIFDVNVKSSFLLAKEALPHLRKQGAGSSIVFVSSIAGLDPFSVLLALHEKGIVFTPYVVDVSNGEQYSSWFLNLNPKGDVPVLQDGCFIIPDSDHIINYLEDKFNKASDLSLIPRDIPVKEQNKIQFYQRVFNRIPIGVISLGSFVHQDLKLNPKPPFIGPIRKACLETNEKVNAILKTCADEDKVNSASLACKVEFQEKRRSIVFNRVEFQKLLDSLESILKYVENDLKNKPDRIWLCTSTLTIADIMLGLLLYRLYSLGFENYFWTNGKMPHIESYLQNFKTRESFQKSVPTSLSILKDVLLKAPSNYKIGVGVLGMAMFAATLAHKVG